METIWKYELNTDDSQVVSIPAGARILTVAVQGGIPVLWAEVRTERPKVKREIITFMTGKQWGPDQSVGRYIGTYILDGGAFVGHVYEGRILKEDY